MDNNDVRKAMLAASECLKENQYDAAIVHLKSALNVLGVLKRQKREKLTGAAGDAVSAVENMGVDPEVALRAVKLAMSAGVGGFENLFKAALSSLRKAA